MPIIEATAPVEWRELQASVARILSEAGLQADVDVTLPMARGSVAIDVLAQDDATTPPVRIVCECKNWKTRVPQNVVHAFRSIVADTGANLGLIVSAAGFQSGAFSAATYSNVQLVSWVQFQEIFAERWFRRHMVPAIRRETDALIQYTEPVNSAVQRRMEALSPQRREKAQALRKELGPLALLCLVYLADIPGLEAPLPALPLRGRLDDMPELAKRISPAVWDATALRPLLEALVHDYRAATAELDRVFAERDA